MDTSQSAKVKDELLKYLEFRDELQDLYEQLKRLQSKISSAESRQKGSRNVITKNFTNEISKTYSIPEHGCIIQLTKNAVKSEPVIIKFLEHEEIPKK